MLARIWKDRCPEKQVKEKERKDSDKKTKIRKIIDGVKIETQAVFKRDRK